MEEVLSELDYIFMNEYKSLQNKYINHIEYTLSYEDVWNNIIKIRRKEQGIDESTDKGSMIKKFSPPKSKRL